MVSTPVGADVWCATPPLVRRGFSIGQRLIDEFLAKSKTQRCSDFREAADKIAKVGFRMFLNTTATVANWNAEGTECSLVGSGCCCLPGFLPSSACGWRLASAHISSAQSARALAAGWAPMFGCPRKGDVAATRFCPHRCGRHTVLPWAQQPCPVHHAPLLRRLLFMLAEQARGAPTAQQCAFSTLVPALGASQSLANSPLPGPPDTS